MVAIFFTFIVMDISFTIWATPWKKRVFGHMRSVDVHADQSLYCPLTESLDNTKYKNGE